MHKIASPKSCFYSIGTRSPVSTVSTVSSASSRAVSLAAANEVTMETQDRQQASSVIDAKSSAAKV